MSEPTIDEMLEWLSEVTSQIDTAFDDADWNRYNAIRAILEQHRELDRHIEEQTKLLQSNIDVVELEAVRAFVERVQARERDGRVWAAIWDELAEMEKEHTQ